MEKESALYQLMGVRMNGVMNCITNSDGEYQEIIQKSDVYSGRLEEMELPEEVWLLIDRYVNEQNVLGSLYGMLAYLSGFSDCKEMLLEKCLPPRTCWILTTAGAFGKNRRFFLLALSGKK